MPTQQKITFVLGLVVAISFVLACLVAYGLHFIVDFIPKVVRWYKS